VTVCEPLYIVMLKMHERCEGAWGVA